PFTHRIQVFRPLPLTPSTANSLQAVTQSSPLFRSTCPNQRSLPRLTTSDTLSICKRCNNSSILTLSFNDTPHIHLNIILSALSSLCISSTLIAHVSLPYINTDCTQALYTFPFNLSETLLAVRIEESSLNLHQAHLTLALDASTIYYILYIYN